MRSLSYSSGIPSTSLFRLMKDGMLQRHSSSLKPHLTNKNRKERVEYCRSFVNEQGVFDPMMNCVHIDEKWFFMTRDAQNYYLLPGEERPNRKTKSKRFITKVMFLAAVAIPRIDPHTKCLFDGKLGIWPFTIKEAAKRNSKNRAKGTMVTKAVESITKDVVKQMILEKVIPAVKQNWPVGRRGEKIYIQQDNARPHPSGKDKDISSACTADNWNIECVFQPANSPDMNILDLGYFNSIQSLQQKMVAKNIDELIGNVQKSFENLTPVTLNNVWLSLQLAMQETMRCGGDNTYKLGHMKKES